jgi:2,4-diketo-3-deoxy-L-fuconate hydrolase
VRFGPPRRERPGIVDSDGRVRDLSSVVPDISGAVLEPDGLRKLAAIDLSKLPLAPDAVRFGPCVGSIGKFICIGLNYSDHAAETGTTPPAEPVIFAKATSAVCGPNDHVVQPLESTKLDWEVELGLVIGKTARYVSEQQALEHLAGFCLINDVSERAFQLERGGTWDKGKGCDTFGPMGPWLVTRDEVPDPHNLDMWLEVNGKRYQNGSTRTSPPF